MARLVEGPVAQLEGVAQQHELLHALEALEQRVERGRVAEHVRLRAGAEMQVRDDEGPHGGRDGSPRHRPARGRWGPGSTAIGPTASPSVSAVSGTP